MLYVCIKGVYKCNNELVCKAVKLAFLCQTISLPFILIGLGSVMELYGPLVTTVYVKCLFLTMKYALFRRWVVRIVKSENVMNAKNKLKTIYLMRINAHIVYHAQRIITEWGWGLFKKR